jgi:hypothetical protein
MIPVLTKLQIDKIEIRRSQPLLICDVDEVILHFVNDFEAFLKDRDLLLVVTGFHLSGSISPIGGGALLAPDACTELVARFFEERTAHMTPIAGAVRAIQQLSQHCDVIFLTNLPGEAGDARKANLMSHGLNFPVITNTGPKGPAIRALAAQTENRVAFVDDSPGFLQSSHEYAPHVTTVHFLQDQRFVPYAPDFDFLALRSNNWTETQAFLSQTFNGQCT